MTANKHSTDRAWMDPDDAPDLSEPEWQAKLAATQVRRGRPPVNDRPKVATSLRLDAEVIERLKADGPGWQTRANELLRTALGLR
ncbi:BrnA antitoxin family protein [Azospirillum halopraeferens]|uniref:BrnA antitoxin family protein n=1 Tax=Azospirillum halopraeferens TaxID=34010 RepID=UPI0005516559|nr:BrnA antitoxin family protein [Azospirillum halopraeferens]